MISKFIGWLFIAIVGILLLVVLLPVILIIIIVALFIGLLSGSKFRVWTSRAQAGARAGADTVRSKISEHAPNSHIRSKPGQRKSKVVDADVQDI